MSDAEPTDRQSGSRTGLILVVCVLGYFLSSGPAVWLMQHGYISSNNPILRAYLAPGNWVFPKRGPLHDLMVWYLHLWIGPI